MKFLAFTILIAFTSYCHGQSQPSVIKESRYFEFHSDFWINLHHFLFQQAKGDQVAHLKEDGNLILDIGEESVFQLLSADERKILNTSVQYYQDHLTDKTLLFGLADLRLWLQNQDIQRPITDTTFTKEYSQILNDFSSIYKSRFWEIHDGHNNKILDEHFLNVNEMEVRIIEKLIRLVGYAWPDSKIRVDLSAYASWAGAYSQNKPNFNIIISTLDPFSNQSAFIETVFHEGAHILFNRESKFRTEIFNMSNEMDIKFPRGLWHASQFYLCGRLVQDELEKKNINHELIMDVKNIFSDYNTVIFRSALESYYRNDTDLMNTVKALLNELK